MIEAPRRWHPKAVQLRASIFLLPLLLAVACDPQQPNDDDDGNEPEPCQPPEQGVPLTYTISLVGFPEIEGNALVTTEGLDFSGPCVLDEMEIVDDQLTLALSCEHPTPSVPEGASVAITTAAAGLPAGVEIGDTLTFDASVIHFEHVGGDASGPIFRGLEEAGPEIYELSDADGLVFGARVRGLGAAFEPIVVVGDYNCPEWAPCSGDDNLDSIAAHVRASVGETDVDVHVGEVALLESGDWSWDLSLFSASLHDDCHDGEYGNFSVVRRPE